MAEALRVEYSRPRAGWRGLFGSERHAALAGASLSLRAGDRVVLVCASGDARLSNSKAKAALGAKPRMLGAHEVEEITGHPIGGVCPFGLASALPVYCDVSLQAFDVSDLPIQPFLRTPDNYPKQEAARAGSARFPAPEDAEAALGIVQCMLQRDQDVVGRHRLHHVDAAA